MFFFVWQRQGLVTTYWLVGKEGFDKALPDPPLDVSEPMFETLDVYYASWNYSEKSSSVQLKNDYNFD